MRIAANFPIADPAGRLDGVAAVHECFEGMAGATKYVQTRQAKEKQP